MGPYDGSRCMPSLEVVWVLDGPLDPCAAHVAVSDSSGVASHGLMRCHGHMASNVAHVATWSGVDPTRST